MKRGRCAMLIMLLFSLARCVVGVTECPQMKTFISLTPALVIVKQGINTIVTIHCAAVDDSTVLSKLEVGVLNASSFLATAGTSPTVKNPLFYIEGNFHPDGSGSISGNGSCISIELSGVSTRDLAHTWVCYSEYSQPTYCKQNVTAVFDAIPHPGNTTLTVSPAKATHDADDTASLNCRAFIRLKWKTNSLKVIFQYYDHSQWLDVNVTDSKDYEGITASAYTLKGDFNERSYSLHLRVSGIPSCSRRFRCVLYCGSHVFDDAIAERQVRVTPGTGHCRSSIPGTTSVASPTHINSTTDQYYDVTEEKKASSNKDNRLLWGIIITGVLVSVILAALIVVMVLQRGVHSGGHRRGHRRRHSGGHSRGHGRSSLGWSQERIQAVAPPRRPSVPVPPDPYSFPSQDPTSFYSSPIGSGVDDVQSVKDYSHRRPSRRYRHSR